MKASFRLAGLAAMLMVAPLLHAEAPKYTPLPEAVSSLGAVVCDGWLYVYGGHTGKTHHYSTETVSGKFHRLKLSDPQKWEELPGGPILQGMNLVAFQGKVYRVGGMQPRNQPGEDSDNHSVADCSCYDPSTRKWTAIAALPEARSSHDIVVLGDRLYVVGGWKMTGKGTKPTWLTTTLVLDLTAKDGKWETIEQPFSRRALTAAAVGRKIYVLGGMGAEGGTTRRVDVYDPTAKAWSSVSEFPGTARSGFSPAACEASGRLYVAGADGAVHRFNDKTNAWDQVASLERGRIVARLVTAGNGKLLLVGGAAGMRNATELALVDLNAPQAPKTTP